MNFSFFYTKGGSAYIRGEQMANYIGGKKNPTSGFENDICIYVKIVPPDNHPKHSYADVDDSPKLANHLKTHPELGVIAISETIKDYLSNLLNRKDIIFIPHPHVNFERWIRPVREIKTVGIIGSKTSFQYPIELLRKELKKIGLELKYKENYWNTYKSTPDREMRLKICDFHKEIDIQVVWRPRVPYKKMIPFANPNKLGNASAFGIPTVSYPEPNYIREWNGCFIKTNTIERLIRACKELKDNPNYYDYYSKRTLRRAEDYHIENIVKLYKNLK